MKLQIRLIIVFVSISIVGIFVSQGYWLWSTYHLEKKQLAETIHKLLEQSFAETLAIQLTEIERDSTDNAPHGSLEMGISMDSISKYLSQEENKKVVRFYRNMIVNPQEEHKEPLVFTKDYYKESYDAVRLAATAGFFEMVNTLRPISVLTIDSIWGIHLQQAGINSPYFIDEVFGNDTLIDSSRPKDLPLNDLIQTRRISISMNEQLGLQGFVVDANSIIYKRMFFSFTCSILFVLISIACYIYLIRTIFRQKTEAQIKNDFVNNMTHELKTPITVTYSAIDALQNFKLVEQKEKREEYFNLCKQQLKHLTELVEKILSMAVEDRKNFRLQKESFLLQPIIRRLMAQFTIKANKTVHFQLDDELGDLPVKADKFHLTHVLANLFDNAVKYSGPEVYIRIHIRKTDSNLEITVKDDGIGISSYQQKKIFERFYRITKGNTHDVKGFGLGLSYAKDIIERHGGTIRVCSHEQQGSSFTILIPLAHDTRIIG